MMALILAVDTTTEYGSLALVRDGELLEQTLLHAPGSFARCFTRSWNASSSATP